MKNIKSYFGAALVSAVALTACTPDSFDGANGQIPSLENVEPVVVVDQEINQVTLSLPSGLKNVMPIWIMYDNKGTDKEKITYSTVNGLKLIKPKAGDYDVEFKLMNRNGISDGAKSFSYHIDKTQMDFTKYTTLLCGGTENSSKEWRIDNDKQGHLGCGPIGTTGTEWWNANPNDKAAFGVYDNRMKFGSDMKYTYYPGESGTMYVNHNCWQLFGDNASEPADDYCTTSTEQTVEFEFNVEGDDLYLTFPEHTQFPYIPHPSFWANPRFRVESMTGNEINLVADIEDGGISWHYILTSGAAAVVFKGFDYNSEYNIWKGIDEAAQFDNHYYYAPNWAPIEGGPGFAQNGNEYTFTLPVATTDQWQAQYAIKPMNPLHLSADKKYDFSCVINSTTDLPGVTVKLTDVNSGDNYVFVERVPVKAYEDYVFYVHNVNNLSADADCELFFDFGGNPDNTAVSIKKITLKDAANDDGTVVPSEEPDAPTASVEWREADNLLKGANFGEISYYYAPGWAQIDNPETKVENGAYTLTLPEATSDQWQCQFTFNNTGVKIDPAKKYDFRVVLNTTNAFNGATIKLTQQDNDNVFLTADRHEIKEAYEDKVFEFVGMSAEGIDNLKIVYDFAGAPAGTEITVKDMLLQEHQASADEIEWNADAADNLWTADLVPNSFYYAPNWAQLPNPVVTQSGRAYSFELPEATVDQWQAQITTETNISTSADNKYDFQVVLTADKDIKGVTVKLTKVGDDNVFFTADRHDLSAYEEKAIRFASMPGLDIDKIKLVLDFGGNPADSHIEVKDIILKKH